MKSTCLAVCASLLVTAIASADVIVDWSEVLLQAIRVDRTAPPMASRAMAMVATAMFDAVNAIEGTHRPYLDVPLDVNTAGASEEAASSAAAHRVLVGIFPQQQATFDAALDTSLAAIPDGSAKSRGIMIGEQFGDAMLAARADDGSDADIPYTITNEPGYWQPTPPAFQQTPAQAQWGLVKPFCMTSPSQFRASPPPALTSLEYTEAFNEVKSLGAADTTTRSAEQTQIALFWVDGPGTATPPGHWFEIAKNVSAQRGNTLQENARLFALIGLAVADAGIAGWDAKYFYNHWRPVTAIRLADTDGSDATQADANWLPLIPTPPFPSYVSGHSTFSAAASTVLAQFYGTDTIAFTAETDSMPGVTRSFSTFSQAANEAGRSRVYGGIHWEYDNQAGLSTGRQVAVQVFDRCLQPLDKSIVEVPAEDIVRCGNIGMFPMAIVLMLMPWRLRLRARQTSYVSRKTQAGG